jgi:hypothetical protein
MPMRIIDCTARSNSGSAGKKNSDAPCSVPLSALSRMAMRKRVLSGIDVRWSSVPITRHRTASTPTTSASQPASQGSAMLLAAMPAIMQVQTKTGSGTRRACFASSSSNCASNVSEGGGGGVLSMTTACPASSADS